MLSIRKHLTPAQILQLHTNPTVIVPAPGAGKIVLPNQTIFKLTFNSTAYDLTGVSGFSLIYGPAQPNYAWIIVPELLFTASSNAVLAMSAYDAGQPVQPINDVLNAPLYLIAGTSDPTLGDSDIDMLLTYQIFSA